MTTARRDEPATPRHRMGPLYAAGFVTAFGAHSVAAGVGATGEDIGLSLLRIGFLLALYDIAEVLLKPIFGSLSDRIGAKPVIVGGLIGFAALSLLGLGAQNVALLTLARLGQGAAAAAFSPAASATVARLGAGRTGAYFGRYGSWKALGYTIGPLLGAGLIAWGGLPLLFGVLSAAAAMTAIWVLLALPAPAPLPRTRYTVVDLVRQTTDSAFLVPTLALATSTAALGAAIGFLPALATHLGLSLFAAIAIATVLALASAIVQPWAGSLRDSRRFSDRAGAIGGLLVLAAGILLVAVLPTAVVLYLAAVLIGAGIGVVTPFAFAALADSTPQERMGRTLGTAELGRELGDSAGPLLVGAVAAATALPWGLATLGGAVALMAGVVGVTRSRSAVVTEPTD
ncbi:MFS family permease [Microbacterium terrae]|nr:MFS family permease [Microbacterium terrae]